MITTVNTNVPFEVFKGIMLGCFDKSAHKELIKAAEKPIMMSSLNKTSWSALNNVQIAYGYYSDKGFQNISAERMHISVILNEPNLLYLIVEYTTEEIKIYINK